MTVDIDKKKTNKSTFMVQVIFQQNASWQGQVKWLEGEKEQSFRSVLELVSLMQEAMDKSGSPPADYTLRSWVDWE